MTRLLIVNADDYGLTPGVCDGILRAHRQGVVTSTSAIAQAPAFASHAGAARDAGIGVGVHLCLVGEDPPLLAESEIPTLVGPSGRLAVSWRQLAPRVLAGRVDPEDIRRELDAQIAAVRATGIRPTHLDSHQHVHLLPGIADVTIDLARLHGIAAVRRPWSRRRGPTGASVRALARRLGRRLATAGLVHPATFAGLDRSGAMDRDGLDAELRSLVAEDARTAELGVHPGTSEDPDRVRYDWGFRWPEELEALCSGEVRRAIASAGIALGSFAELGRTA